MSESMSPATGERDEGCTRPARPLAGPPEPSWPGQHLPLASTHPFSRNQNLGGTQALHSHHAPTPATLESLTCEHAPDDGTHACEEVREGPDGGRGSAGTPTAAGPGAPSPHPHLCFSVSFTIMGESSYSTKTPGSPWSPSSPLATFSCLVTENWFVLSTWDKRGARAGARSTI